MKIGISTASLYPDYLAEDAVLQLAPIGPDTVEIFLESYSEYSIDFCLKIKENLDRMGLKVHSVHVLSTQFEQQLFAQTERQRADAFVYYEAVLRGAALMGAKCYVHHGPAGRSGGHYGDWVEANSGYIDQVADLAGEYGIKFAWENVFWCWFCYPEFAGELLSQTNSQNIWFTFDNKQAIRSGKDPFAYVKAMGNRIVNVHVSDFKQDRTMCLPGKGIFDFQRLNEMLVAQRCETPIILEVYRENYKTIDELAESVQYLRKIFI
jgi:sugar phosphate isomerase/epimerase